MNTNLGWLAGAMALCLSGCGAGAEGEEPATGSSSREGVGSVQQALGNPVVLYADHLKPLVIGSTHAIFAGDESCSSNVVSVNLSSASAVSMPLSGCRRVARAAVDGVAVFIQDTYNEEILRSGPTPFGLPGWNKVADAHGQTSGKLLLDATHVYWDDDVGFHRAPRGGGAQTVLKNSPAHLHARDGTKLYYEFRTGSEVEIRQMQVNGTGDVRLATVSGELGDLTFDANYLYWADNTGATNRLMRLSKATLLVSTVTSSTTRAYYLPQSTGTSLYHLFKEGPDAELFMSRRNLSNGNVVSTPFADDHPVAFRVRGDGVYLATGWHFGTLYRGDH